MCSPATWRTWGFDTFIDTMFKRLPRDERMSRGSELSDRAVTLETIDRLFARFRPDMFNCPLFLNRSVDPARGN
jgi:hypothetical protein